MKFFKHSQFIFFFLLSAAPLTLLAQETSPETVLNIESLSEAELRGMASIYELQHEEAEGSPFFYQAWLPGEVTLENGSRFMGSELLYDVYNDLVVVKRAGDEKAFVINKDIIQSFHLGKNTRSNMANFVKESYLENDIASVDDQQFLQVLYEGDGFLYARNHKKLDGSEFSELQADYFYVDPEGEVHTIEPNKKAILETFPDQREALADYIDGRDLDVSQRDDLVEVIMYYTTEVN